MLSYCFNTVCKLNPNSEVGNAFIFYVMNILAVCVGVSRETVSVSRKNKTVANLAVRIEFTYGTTKSE